MSVDVEMQFGLERPLAEFWRILADIDAMLSRKNEQLEPTEQKPVLTLIQGGDDAA